ncbi:NAD-dependent epimerase/dehydratase family protein [candidate division WOR-3 bacterium]|nr:NAD-dependent epimerase/dehydratase family protein [candidate division WOR-3 bacterium]
MTPDFVRNRALVTGCAGFIGSHLCERLVRDGHDVIGVDCFTDYYAREIKESNIKWLKEQSNFIFCEANLLDTDLLKLMAAVDVVFHQAAQAGVRASWGKDFRIYAENNVLATQLLLEAAKEVDLNKFIYASSSSVYGDAETYPTAEDLKPMPISPYGVSKLAGEHLCALYHRNFGVPAISLRYFTVYGPRQRPDMAFHKFIKAMLRDQEVVVFGDGNQTRDFTYINDIVEANVLAMNSEAAGEIFNIGGGSRVTVREIITIMEHILVKKANVRHIENQRGDVRHTAADITKARSRLKYEPKFDLQMGIANEINWLRTFQTEILDT